jgi:hypothetical protein
LYAFSNKEKLNKTIETNHVYEKRKKIKCRYLYLNHRLNGYHQKVFPDLSKYDEIAIDLETKDPDLMKMGFRFL